jgi:O-antigen/teichoic acid export membrane protein
MKYKLAKDSVASHGLLSISSQIVWGAQGFIAFVIAGRLLPQRQLGFVVAANAILFGGQCLLLGPVTNPTLHFGSFSRKAVVVTYWMYCAVTSLVCAVFVLLGKQLGGLIYKDPAFLTVIKYLSIPFATTSFYLIQKLVLFARSHYKMVLVMDILYTLSNILLLLSFHAKGMLSSATMFYMARSGAAVIGLFPVAFLSISSKRTHMLLKEQQFAYKSYFKHSTYSSISMLSSYGQNQVDILAVAHFLTPLSAAIYGVGKIFYTGITMVTTGLTMVVLPTSSRIVVSGKPGLGKFYRKALVLAYAILLPSIVTLAIAIHPVLHLLFGNRYVNAAPIVRIFCLAALVIPVSSLTDAVANGAGWWQRACVAAVTGGLIGIGASLYLTRTLGIYGAAFSPILALSGSAFVIAWLIWGRLRASNSVSTATLDMSPQ